MCADENSNSYWGSGLSRQSIHNHLLTGMYGGETLGGNAVYALPEKVQMDTSAKHKELAESLEIRRRKSKLQFNEFYSTENDLAFSTTQFSNSFMSFLYNDNVWSFPFLLMQKKKTPFLNTKLLIMLYKSDYSRLDNFKFYAELYSKCAPQFLKYPFNSKINLFDYPGIQAVKIENKNKLSEELYHTAQPSKKNCHFDFMADAALAKTEHYRNRHKKLQNFINLIS